MAGPLTLNSQWFNKLGQYANNPGIKGNNTTNTKKLQITKRESERKCIGHVL